MPKKHNFTATIRDAGRGGAFMEIPFDVEKDKIEDTRKFLEQAG